MEDKCASGCRTFPERQNFVSDRWTEEILADSRELRGGSPSKGVNVKAGGEDVGGAGKAASQKTRAKQICDLEL